jgi:predicted DNA-binding transcriptional regulator AlpA
MDKTRAVRGELLNVTEAAKRSGMSKRWIYNQLRSPSPPFDWFRPSCGKILFDSADIDDWLNQIKVRTKEPDRRCPMKK